MTRGVSRSHPTHRLPSRRLTIRSLGAFDVTVDGRRLSRAEWQRVSAERLVKLLVVTPGHRVQRELAAATLWPEANPESARANLRKGLLFAARALRDPTLIVVDGDAIGLDRSRIDIDLDRLEDAYRRFGNGTHERDAETAAAPMETVLELGWQELLPDDRYEDWLVASRERLRDRWQRTALPIAEAAAARDGTELALGIVARVLDADPTDEAAHRLAIGIYARQGRHHAARRQFELCRRALRDELDVDPAPETLAAIAQAERLPDRSRAAPRERLVGRGRELQRLEASLDRVASGRSAAIVIHGAAGIGKTRLLEEVAAYASTAGWRICWWRPVESARTIAYASLRMAIGGSVEPGELDALDEPGRSGLATLIGGSGGPGLAFADPAALDAALVGGLCGLAARRPLLLAVDDLGMLDAASSRVVEALVASRAHVPILVAATCRNDEPAPPTVRTFRDLVRCADGLELAVGALARRDLGPLVVEHLGGQAVVPALERRLFAESAGNPLFCLELVRLRRDSGEIVADHGRWTESGGMAPPTLPGSVAQLVERRLTALSSPTRELLVVAAELGPACSYAMLSAVLGETSDDLLGQVDAAISAGLLVERESGYGFAHPLYRLAILDTAGAARRGGIQLRVAGALAGIDPSSPTTALTRAAEECADPIGPAMHALAALDLGQPEARSLAVAFGFRAGDAAAAVLDRQLAVDLLERSLNAWRAMPLATARAFAACTALVALARLRSATGEDAAATRSLREAIAVATTPSELAQAYSALHWVPYQHGDFEAAIAILDEGLARLPHDDPASRALLRRDRGWCLVRLGRFEDGVRILEHASRVLGKAGNRAETMRALDYLGDSLGLLGRHERAIVRLQQALALALELRDSHGEAAARLHLGATLTTAGRAAQAEPHLRRAVEVAHETGERYTESVAWWILAEMADALDDVATATEHLERELRLLREIGGNPRNEALAHAHLAHLARRAGASGAANREAARARARATRARDPAFTAQIEAALALERWSDFRFR